MRRSWGCRLAALGALCLPVPVRFPALCQRCRACPLGLSFVAVLGAFLAVSGVVLPVFRGASLGALSVLGFAPGVRSFAPVPGCIPGKCGY